MKEMCFMQNKTSRYTKKKKKQQEEPRNNEWINTQYTHSLIQTSNPFFLPMAIKRKNVYNIHQSLHSDPKAFLFTLSTLREGHVGKLLKKEWYVL